MEHSTLIFHIVFSDEEIEQLKHTRDQLADLLLKLNNNYGTNQFVHKVKLPFAILDLNEVILRHNSAGYIWSSYVISILLIKLQYLIEIESRAHEGEETELLHELLKPYLRLDEMLEKKRSEKELVIN